MNNDNDVQEEEDMTLPNENGATMATSDSVLPHSTTNMSPYERMVVDLFPNIDNTDGSNPNNDTDDDRGVQRQHDVIATEDAHCIDPYWMDPLLSLTKSSARSLVRQLQPAGCPMGYDPAASPISSLLRNTTTPQKRTTSLLSYVRRQKSILGDAVV